MEHELGVGVGGAAGGAREEEAADRLRSPPAFLGLAGRKPRARRES